MNYLSSPAIIQTLLNLEQLIKVTPAALANTLNRHELSASDLHTVDTAAEQIRRYASKLRHLVQEYRKMTKESEGV